MFGFFCNGDHSEGVTAYYEEHAEMLGEMLTRAIDILPESERIVVSLLCYERLSCEDVSIILALSPAQVNQIYVNAMNGITARTSVCFMPASLKLLYGADFGDSC